MSRNGAEQYWVYGRHAVRVLLETRPHAVKALWLAATRRDASSRQLRALAERHGISVQDTDTAQLDRMLSANHQGVLASVRPFEAGEEVSLSGIVERAGRDLLLLVLDGVQDPHNLGACLRTANAAGVHAVIGPKDKSVGLTAAARKVASGAAELTPFFQVTNLGRTLRELKAQGVWLAGLADRAETGLYEADLTGPRALILGGEGRGLRRLTLELCDDRLRIPMAGGVESLNVSVAAGVCLYEAVRQRTGAGRR